MSRSLPEIHQEMEALVDLTGDPEAAHSLADTLLVETVQWVAAQDHNAVRWPWLREIVANYEKIGRWYA